MKSRRKITCSTNMLKVWCKKLKLITKVILRLKVTSVFWIFCVSLTLIAVLLCIHNTNDPKVHPIIVWWTHGFPGPQSGYRECSDFSCFITNERNHKDRSVDAYLFYGSEFNIEDLPLPRNPSDIVWGIYHEESPRNVELLMHERILNLFNFSSTFSRYSDLAFPLQCLEDFNDITKSDYFVDTKTKTEWLKEISPIIYLQTDCETTTERDAYVKELMNFITIDSYGACLNNKKLPEKFKGDYLNNLTEEEFLNFVARYKFSIAIENAVCEDYITEKLWRALTVGSVPIYFGSPSVKDWLPNVNSALLINDFKNPAHLASHLKVLMNNDTLYEEYLEHKTKKVITNERLSKEFYDKPWTHDALTTVEKFECFICRKLYETRNSHNIESIVNSHHYNCPKPISALTSKVNQKNPWVWSWGHTRKLAEQYYNKVMNKN